MSDTTSPLPAPDKPVQPPPPDEQSKDSAQSEQPAQLVQPVESAQPDIQTALTEAAAGLLFMSESDYPFEFFLWKDAAAEPLTDDRVRALTNHLPDARVDTKPLDEFFRNAMTAQEWHDDGQRADVERYQKLYNTLTARLSEIIVYRIGETEVHAYITGKVIHAETDKPATDYAGLSTIQIET